MRKRSQHGVALISALLVVALASTAAAQLMYSQYLDLRRSGNLFLRDQAWQYLRGSEDFAMILLDKAIKNNRLYDLLEQESVFPVEGGSLGGKITDLQGRININAVVDGSGKVNSLVFERLQKLLGDLGIPTALADAIVDWIDKDNNPISANGAEDDYYLGLDPPYRSANTRFESLSELLLVRGYQKLEVEKRKALEQNITALPADTNININSASADVLKAVGFKEAGISTIRERLSSDGTKKPFGSMDEIKQLKLLPEDKLGGLGTTTEYFELTTTAQIGRTRLKQYSIIHRLAKSGATQVIARSLGTP